MVTPTHPPQLPPLSQRQIWQSCFGLSASLSIAQSAQQAERPALIVTKDAQTAYRLQRELHFFSKHEIPIHYFPDWEILPYDHFSPHEDLVSQRLAVLNQCAHLSRGIILISLSTLMQRLLPTRYLHAQSFNLNISDTLNIEKFRHDLTTVGYHHVEQVFSHGEYAIRGSIIDVFPMGSQYPFRIELFDTNIESIRYFDTESQRSLDKCEQIRLKNVV